MSYESSSEYSSSYATSSDESDEDYTNNYYYYHHHHCSQCGRYFQNENNLRMHSRIHSPRTQECYGCNNRDFASFSAMLIHLESGSCAGGADRERIDELAFTCYQYKKYTRDRGEYYPYYCWNCGTRFRFVSALFQHVETRPDCEFLLEGGNCLAKLRWFIRWRV